jgi:hypothetical protein
MTTTTKDNPKVVSLGYRCSTAGILKRLGFKTESYPFDWIVSRLPIIQDCIESDFAFFTNPTFYTKLQTHTTHYHPGTTPTPLHICNETIYRNDYYQEHPLIQDQIRIPKPLSIQNGDTYAHTCLMNHRDIHETDTQDYYHRCIDRFQNLLQCPPTHPVVAIYIHPTLTEGEFAEQRQQLQHDFARFQMDTIPTHWTVVFFWIVRTEHPYPITDYKSHVIETVVDTPHTKMYIVYTNRDFIDAGEIFMQNAYIETDYMCNLIQTLCK